jgi:hypothetical protein
MPYLQNPSLERPALCRVALALPVAERAERVWVWPVKLSRTRAGAGDAGAVEAIAPSAASRPALTSARASDGKVVVMMIVQQFA